MADNFQGDPKLSLDENGSRLTFIGGQPVMDQGLENQALISLFTSPGWFGNVLFDDPNQKIGSNFEEAANQPITVGALNDIAKAAEKALESPIFGNIDVTVNNPVGNILDVTIRIEPPGQDVQTLLVSKNGLNWINQNINPAYLRT